MRKKQFDIQKWLINNIGILIYVYASVLVLMPINFCIENGIKMENIGVFMLAWLLIGVIVVYYAMKVRKITNC